MKTKAAVLTEIGKPLDILEVEQEGPKAGEVRVRVKAAGVCMSDWHLMNGDWPTKLPIVLGHEAAGIIEDVGAGVTTVNRDDQSSFRSDLTADIARTAHAVDRSFARGMPIRLVGYSSTVPHDSKSTAKQ